MKSIIYSYKITILFITWSLPNAKCKDQNWIRIELVRKGDQLNYNQVSKVILLFCCVCHTWHSGKLSANLVKTIKNVLQQIFTSSQLNRETDIFQALKTDKCTLNFFLNCAWYKLCSCPDRSFRIRIFMLDTLYITFGSSCSWKIKGGVTQINYFILFGPIWRWFWARQDSLELWPLADNSTLVPAGERKGRWHFILQKWIGSLCNGKISCNWALLHPPPPVQWRIHQG